MSGLLPPLRIRKRIAGASGVTGALGVPMARFDVHAVGAAGVELRYRRWPVVDRIRPVDAGERAEARSVDGARWIGTGHLLGWRFCTFALVPD